MAVWSILLLLLALHFSVVNVNGQSLPANPVGSSTSSGGYYPLSL